MSIKVKKLAEELGVKTESVIEALQKLYVDVEDENSTLDDKIAALIQIKMGGKPKAKPAKEKKTKTRVRKTPKKTGEKTAGEAAAESKEPAAKKKKPKPKEEAPEAGAVSGKETEKPADPSQKTEDGRASGIKKLDKVVVVKPASETIKDEEDDKVIKLKLEEPGAGKTIEDDEDKSRRKGTPGPRKIYKTPGKRPLKTEKNYPKKIRKVYKMSEAVRKPDIAYEEIKAYEGTDLEKIQLQVPCDIRSIAVKVNKRPNDLIQYLMRKGSFVSINQNLDEELIRELLKDLGYELEISQTIEEDLMAEHHEEEKAHIESRAPIVTFMGHVDHGKTSLMDYIRKTMVTKKEKGGITQHIGAYKVETSKGAVTFLDTPGHEAFTAMRSRGANATDVVVLVVAADDGVMPQTKEAIGHARAADVPIVVAINKCDLPGANPDKVKVELQREGLVSEDFGGETVMVEVSAKTGEGVDDLVEMLMLESELLELKANPALKARGIIIESKKTSGQGVTATLLVQNGTLRCGDIILTGIYYGKTKAMINDVGERVEEAPPATPVEVLGLQGVPEAGDAFYVVKDEKKARTLSMIKQKESRKKEMVGSQRITLEDFHKKVADGTVKELQIILKADVQGSVGAISSALKDLSTDEVKVNFVHSMVGDINESDIMLAMVSNAVIIGFHVKVEPKADTLAKSESIDVRVYDVIYEAISDVKAAMEGLLEPVEQEVFQASLQVKQVFSAKEGKAAGCMVAKGTIHRKDRIRLKRKAEILFDGKISSLKRFRDDVKEVREGFECGVTLQDYNAIQEGDVIEAYIIEKIARRLDSPKKG